MLRRDFVKAGGTVIVAAAAAAGGTILGAEQKPCYMPGDVVDGDVFLQDAQLKPIKLLDAVKPGTKVVALALIGGAYLTTTDKHGGMWCEDTLDEFPNLKAANTAWKDRGVQFIGVACPPVYSDRYGWGKNVFLDEPDSSPKYQQAVKQFVERTEALRKDRTIPFDPLYYDPRFRLLWNAKEHEATAAYGPVHPWQGRFKWHKDEQRYSTPVIWFLDAKGKVLREPLYGNDYAGVPPRILYTYWELEAAIGEALSK